MVTRQPGSEPQAETVIDEVVDRVGELAFDFVAESNPRLESLGLRYFRRRATRVEPLPLEDEIHVLNERELARLRRIEYAFVALAALAGALSGIASGVAEVVAAPLLGPDGVAPGLSARLGYHAIVQGVTIVATIAEVGVLYWLGLRGVHDLAHAAGLTLTVDDDPTKSTERAVALALARVALELPNPPANAFGVDPYRELPKWRLVLAGLLYKLKITLTTFIARALLARFATRFGVRTWLAFLSAPITAAWDALVARHVIREARIRAMGPSASETLLRSIEQARPNLSEAARECMARAAAAAIVRRADLHPNLVALLAAMRRDVGSIEALDDTERFLATLGSLEPTEHKPVLEVLALAAIIDGHLTRAERALLRAAAERCGRIASLEHMGALLRDFTAGRAVTRIGLAAVFPLRSADTRADTLA